MSESESKLNYLPYTTAVACVTLLVAAVVWISRAPRRGRNLPPGPPTKPVIGNLGQVKGYEDMAKFTEKYGKDGVCSVYFGNQLHILVTDYELIKNLLNDDAYTGRPFNILRDQFFKRKGLLFTEGPLWREQRRFALSTLRDFGMGKAWLQDLIIEEVQELVRDIEAKHSQPINPTNYLTPSVSNVICAISYGKRFDHKDENFRRLTTLIGRNIQLNAQNYLVGFFPLLRLIPFSSFRKRFLAFWKNQGEVLAFLQTLVDDHESNFHEGEARDYIHAYMNETIKQKDNTNTTFTRDQLLMSIINLFGAGTETTATTLTWAIIYLLENPDCYKKVQEEVDQVIPNGSFPNLEEKENLPYLQATIMEIQRLANLVPIAGRSTLEQTELNGFIIPAHTVVLPLLSAVHLNPKYFPNPKKFDPTRFLDESGRLKQKVEGFFPFSVGKRFCLGESLAKMEVYLFFASLVKYFTFRLPPGMTVSSSKSIMGVVNSPLPFEVIFEPRVL